MPKLHLSSIFTPAFVPVPTLFTPTTQSYNPRTFTHKTFPVCVAEPDPLHQSPKPPSSEPNVSVDVRSVNYFISRACNYRCKFYFHTQKTTHHLPLQDAIRGIHALHAAGTQKINFAGGEPFLFPQLLGHLCRECHSLGIAVSIISNGSLITSKWIQTYGQYVDILGVSIDSFNPHTNASIGRGGDANNKHLNNVLRVRELCQRHSILFKMNTVVCSLNWHEDMSKYVRQLDPYRWKVFQVLILHGENAGAHGDLRDARSLVVTDKQFWQFVFRHNMFHQLVAEPNDVMRDSYLLLDEELRFLSCTGNTKIPRKSILDVGVHGAIKESGFDTQMFYDRGGVYEWKRPRQT